MTIHTHEVAYRGREALEQITKPRIFIAGCGALGSNLAESLARHGFKHFTILDMDRVEEHNIGTQVWTHEDIGSLKVDALANKLWSCGDQPEIELSNKKLDKSNVKRIIKNVDLVVDCFDNNEARQVITDFCLANKLPCIHAGLFEDYGEVIWNESYNVPADPVTDTEDVCDYPLARNIIMLTVTVLAEQILSYFTSENFEKKSLAITLKDLKITKLGV